MKVERASDWISELRSSDEATVLERASIEEPWQLVETFAELVRESGTKDEQIAFEYIGDRLSAFGVPHQTFTPILFISVPRAARLEVVAPQSRVLTAKTVSMSASTNGRLRSGTLAYIPGDGGDLLRTLLSTYRADGSDIRGKVVITEGLAGPGKVAEFMRLGASAAIFINPGERIHESICSTIWGTPDLDSWDTRPSIPVISVNGSEGDYLRGLARQGPTKIRFSTRLDEGWVECPLCVAEIPGNQAPEEFVLVHGHVDSWHVGVGDNATGDATLLELARVLWAERDQLARSVRIAWWPGHSQGRYAGSAWYADTFALDIDANCIAHINCDSPGCRWATVYEDVFWMTEAEGLAKGVISDSTGQSASGGRPLRAGDMSFANIGVSTFLMLSSTMPKDLVKSKGFHPTGGCGGNIAWHTEDDVLEIADRENLLRDIKLYLLAALRTANATVHPLNFVDLCMEFDRTLTGYEEATNGEFNLSETRREVELLGNELEDWYGSIRHLLDRSAADPDVRKANETLRQLSRLLVPINYTRAGKFQHDPAIDLPPLPDLARATSWAGLENESDKFHLTQAQLIRGRNRVTAAIRSARRLLSASDGG